MNNNYWVKVCIYCFYCDEWKRKVYNLFEMQCKCCLTSQSVVTARRGPDWREDWGDRPPGWWNASRIHIWTHYCHSQQCTLLLNIDLLGSLTDVREFSPPQCRNTAEERAGPFQQVWPPVNFMLACLKLADWDAESSRNMYASLQKETSTRPRQIDYNAAKQFAMQCKRR